MQREFLTYNPIAIFIYFMLLVGIVISTASPAVLFVSVAVSLFYIFMLGGIKSLIKNILMMIITVFFITLINILFTHRGNTNLFNIGENAVTLEALLFGLFAGCVFANIIVWFECLNKILNGEMILYLFSRISSFFALFVSMIFRYIPLLRKRYAEISNVQRCMGVTENGSLLKKIKTTARRTSILISWSLEASIETADSMAARGYGLKGRSTYSMYKFILRDLFLTFLMILFASISLFFMKKYDVEVIFYPSVEYPQCDLHFIVVLLSFFALSMIAPILDLIGDIKWKRLK